MEGVEDDPVADLEGREGRLSRMRSHRLSIQADYRPSIDVRDGDHLPERHQEEAPGQEQQGGWLSTAFKAVGLGGDHHKPGHTDKDPQQVDSWTRAAEHGTDSGPTGYSHQRDAAPAHEDDSVDLAGKARSTGAHHQHNFSDKAGDVPVNNPEGAHTDHNTASSNPITGLYSQAASYFSPGSGRQDRSSLDDPARSSLDHDHPDRSSLDVDQKNVSQPIVGIGIHDEKTASEEVGKLKTEAGEQPLAQTRVTSPAAAVNTDLDPQKKSDDLGGDQSENKAQNGGVLAGAGAAASGAAAYVKDTLYGSGGSKSEATGSKPEAASLGSSSQAGTGISSTGSITSGKATVSPAEAEKLAGSPADPTEHAHPEAGEAAAYSSTIPPEEQLSFGNWNSKSDSGKQPSVTSKRSGQASKHGSATLGDSKNSASGRDLHGTLSDLRPESAFATHSQEMEKKARAASAKHSKGKAGEAASPTGSAASPSTSMKLGSMHSPFQEKDKAKVGCCGFRKQKA